MNILEKFTNIHESWKQDFLEIQETHKKEFDDLFKLLVSVKRRGFKFFPLTENIFKSFETDKNEIRVLILGQDPYPQLGFATGIAFAIPEDSKFIPKSLEAIWDEVSVRGANDITYGSSPLHRTLEHWVNQGVMLLNSSLTVQEKIPNSHSDQWRFFTQEILNRLNENVIICAWGNNAQSFQFKQKNVLTAAHPAVGSYNSSGFFGCNHFNKINNLLQTKINW